MTTQVTLRIFAYANVDQYRKSISTSFFTFLLKKLGKVHMPPHYQVSVTSYGFLDFGLPSLRKKNRADHKFPVVTSNRQRTAMIVVDKMNGRL